MYKAELRNLTLSAASVAEADGFLKTHEALLTLVKELERSDYPRVDCVPSSHTERNNRIQSLGEYPLR